MSAIRALTLDGQLRHRQRDLQRPAAGRSAVLVLGTAAGDAALNTLQISTPAGAAQPPIGYRGVESMALQRRRRQRHLHRQRQSRGRPDRPPGRRRRQQRPRRAERGRHLVADRCQRRHAQRCRAVRELRRARPGGTGSDTFVFGLSASFAALCGTGGSDTLDYSACTRAQRRGQPDGRDGDRGGRRRAGHGERGWRPGQRHPHRRRPGRTRGAAAAATTSSLAWTATTCSMGGTGRDLLAGGNGADALSGGGGEDILVGLFAPASTSTCML